MNLLIAYATKSGTTKDAALMLAEHFAAHNITLADLGEETPRVEDFDAVVIGSYIRAGKIAKSATAFLKNNREAILARPFGLYICCNFADNALAYFKSNFDDSLWQSAASAMNFGGEMRIERQKGIEKLIMKAVLHFVRANNRDMDRERDIALPALIPENISRFADELKSRL
ncbi:MAG: flavodoxin [Ruminococcaceae bacterium]|nr:flavodoxin [Oscillospiraceae bacterium]